MFFDILSHILLQIISVWCL